MLNNKTLTMLGSLSKYSSLALFWFIPQDANLYRYLNGFFANNPHFTNDIRNWMEDEGTNLYEDLYRGYEFLAYQGLGLEIGVTTVSERENEPNRYAFYLKFDTGDTVNRVNELRNFMVHELKTKLNLDIDPNTITINIFSS